MASALKLLTRRGYRRIRVEDVAEDAGVSKATVYHYFANKDDLLTRTVAGRIADKHTEIEQRLASAGGNAADQAAALSPPVLDDVTDLASRAVAAAARQRDRDRGAGRLRRLGPRTRAAVACRRAADQGRTADRRISPRRRRRGRRPDHRLSAVAPGVVSRALRHAAFRPVRRRSDLRVAPSHSCSTDSARRFAGRHDGNRMSHFRCGLQAVSVLCVVTLLQACNGSKAAPAPAPPPEVSVITVMPERVALTSEWIATLDGYVNAQIRPQVAGYLLKRDYEEGAVVRKGQVLFEIDARPLESALAQARAQLGEAQAQLGKTERDQQRDRPLAAAARDRAEPARRRRAGEPRRASGRQVRHRGGRDRAAQPRDSRKSPR